MRTHCFQLVSYLLRTEPFSTILTLCPCDLHQFQSPDSVLNTENFPALKLWSLGSWQAPVKRRAHHEPEACPSFAAYATVLVYLEASSILQHIDLSNPPILQLTGLDFLV
jgi:hypothetical protein